MVACGQAATPGCAAAAAGAGSAAGAGADISAADTGFARLYRGAGAAAGSAGGCGAAMYVHHGRPMRLLNTSDLRSTQNLPLIAPHDLSLVDHSISWVGAACMASMHAATAWTTGTIGAGSSFEAPYVCILGADVRENNSILIDHKRMLTCFQEGKCKGL